MGHCLTLGSVPCRGLESRVYAVSGRLKAGLRANSGQYLSLPLSVKAVPWDCVKSLQQTQMTRRKSTGIKHVKESYGRPSCYKVASQIRLIHEVPNARALAAFAVASVHGFYLCPLHGAIRDQLIASVGIYGSRPSVRNIACKPISDAPGLTGGAARVVNHKVVCQDPIRLAGTQVHWA
jgi:hypothetical protein